MPNFFAGYFGVQGLVGRVGRCPIQTLQCTNVIHYRSFCFWRVFGSSIGHFSHFDNSFERSHICSTLCFEPKTYRVTVEAAS